jgi:hypothetical protein
MSTMLVLTAPLLTFLLSRHQCLPLSFHEPRRSLVTFHQPEAAVLGSEIILAGKLHIVPTYFGIHTYAISSSSGVAIVKDLDRQVKVSPSEPRPNRPEDK